LLSRLQIKQRHYTQYVVCDLLQVMIEKIRSSTQDAFIHNNSIIDYSKAFDSVIHHQLFKTMIQMGCPKRFVSLTAGLYKNQTATIS